MHINKLREENELLNIFCDLVQIPSPSKSEEKVSSWISQFCDINGIKYRFDEYRNLYLIIEATDKNKQPILLSAHMDVVGDASPINIELKDDFIKTDGERTLGADNKAGVACALMLAKELCFETKFSHGGLEIIFTRDEEHGMSGIKAVEFNKINSKYVLVLDADKLGQLLVSGASYTNATLKITTPLGGHSGIDIHDADRLNAAKLIADLTSKIPQGVYYADKTGTITSINLGTIIGGNINNAITNIFDNNLKLKDYGDFFIENAVTNVINTSAHACYSIRSASVEKEEELINLIKAEVEKFNAEHKDLAHAKVEFSKHLPPFEKSCDEMIEKIHTKASSKLKINQNIASFHAGAETHIYAQNKNAKGENLTPFLVGMADIYNMHSCSEMINYKTLLQGYELLKEMFYLL